MGMFDGQHLQNLVSCYINAMLYAIEHLLVSSVCKPLPGPAQKGKMGIITDRVIT